jgi:hypothetical protein
LHALLAVQRHQLVAEKDLLVEITRATILYSNLGDPHAWTEQRSVTITGPSSRD